MRNKESTPQHRGGDHPQQPQTLTIAEAAQACGLSTSTIRRYLRDGRFPGARQAPSPVPGQARHWRIPTDDIVQAGLDRQRPAPLGHAEQDQAPADPAGTWAGRDGVQALEHALELERTCRQAAEVLAAERARTIVTLEAALRALEHPPRKRPPAGLRRPRQRPGGRATGRHLGQADRPGSCGWFPGRDGPRANPVRRSARRSSGGR